MESMPEFPGAMRLDLRLSAEGGGRFLRVTVRSAAEATTSANDGAEEELAPRNRPKDVVPALLAAVGAGLFSGPSEGQRIDIVRTEAHERAGERIEAWEWLTPPLELDALAVFARMIWSTGARALAIAQNAPEERLTLRALDHGPKRTERTLPWETESHVEDDAKNAVILVCFRDDAPPEIVRGTHALLRAWGAVVSLGGFTGGASFPRSAALFSEVGTELRREVFAKFDALSVGRDGWSALWTGLMRIHTHARIARVEVR